MRGRALPWVHGLVLWCALFVLSCAGERHADEAHDASDGAPNASLDGGSKPPDQGPDSGNEDAPSTLADAETDSALGPAPGCGEVPTTGRCADLDSVEVCVQPTGSSEPQATRYHCAAGERCDDSGASARCVLIADCIEGTTRCLGASTLETCTQGHFTQTSCARSCLQSPLGAVCALDLDTQTWTGKLTYDAHLPNAELTDWSSTATTLSAPGFLLLAYRGDALVDAVTTSAQGSFAISVPSTPTADDRLVIMAAGGSPSSLGYAVIDPGFAPSKRSQSTFEAPPAPRLWSWSVDLSGLNDGDTIHIAVDDGSAAARVFDHLRRIYALGESTFHPAAPQTVVVWLGLGTSWDCGACMAPLPTSALDYRFAHQVWLDGSGDQGYWSDAVTIHELGHYVMSAFGYSVQEGGPHYLGVPTNPGQAWGEGWATFMSSLVRDSSVYFDKQAGTFFWIDVDLRTYSDENVPWQRPVAELGLTQRMDENEVSALLWGIYRSLGKSDDLLRAVASPRMTESPFARGYTRRDWDDPDHPERYQDSHEPQPYLADYLDALICTDTIPLSALDAITEPTVHYPYESESPLCK